MRLTHDQVIRFCNANLGCDEGFPLRLANESANIAYGAAIELLESMLIELRRLQSEQSIIDTTKNGKKR